MNKAGPRNFMIGQRVIVGEQQIMTIVPPPKGHESKRHFVWVRSIIGIEHEELKINVQPLPNGQL